MARMNRMGTGLLISLLLFSTAAPGWTQESQPRPETANGDRRVAAAASNIIYVPGKAVTCVMGVVVWTGGMLLTLGTAYNPMANIVRGTCGGKWALGPQDFHFRDAWYDR